MEKKVESKMNYILKNIENTLNREINYRMLNELNGCSLALAGIASAFFLVA